MKNKPVKFLWVRTQIAKARNLVYSFINFTEKAKIYRMEKLLSERLADKLAGKKPRYVTVEHRAGWSKEGKLDSKSLHKDFVDLRLKDESKLIIRKEKQ